MAVIGSTYLNLIDVYKRTEDGQQAAAIIEVLKQMNPILDDAIAVECNMGTIHRHTIRTGLPSVAWGRLYQGVAQSKSTTQQIDDTTGFLEAMSGVDQRLLDLAPNRGALRLSEATAFLEAMNQEMGSAMFYSSTDATPEKFKGLAARYNALTGVNASTSASQIVDAGGVGSTNTSIWFVTWGEQYTQLLYPKGTQAGVKREDMGRQRVLDASGNPYFVEEEKFTWHMGVAVKDWRYNARIANLDITAVRGGTVDIYKQMRRAYYKLQSRRVAGGKMAIYCNREILEALDALSTNNGSTNNYIQLRPMEIEGKEVLAYRGIPIRETDSLLNTEARVV